MGAAILLTAACSASDDFVPETTPAPTPTTTIAGSPDIEGLPGRLVTIDDAGNVVVVEPDGSSPVAVTDDAGDTARYFQPSWSPGGDRLAWSEVSLANGIGVTFSDAAGDERVTVPMDSAPFFMYWSPDGAAMGVLHNGAEGAIDFELVDTAEATTRVVADGAPFYFSWSPDSDRLVAHVGGEDFALLGLDGVSTDLGPTAVDYPAPHWTPAGIFHLGSQGLVLHVVGISARVLAATTGPATLVANPQGTRLAAQTFRVGDGAVGVALEETPTLPNNAVVVIDIPSGELSAVTVAPSVGFFWSPDGESLLILEPTPVLGEIRLTVWRDGETTTAGVLSPHPLFVRDVLQFFDQYSQAVRVWSPDSSAFALAGEVEGEAGIWVYLIEEEEPVRVSDGSWAVWSDR
jgi:hypothetical protein